MANDVSRKISTASNTYILCAEIVEILQKIFPFHHLSLWLYSSQTKEAILKAETRSAPYPKNMGNQSKLRIPIKIHDEVLGFFNVESDKKKAFDESDILLIETIADLCALVIHQNNLFLLNQENKFLRSMLHQKTSSPKIIGESTPLKQLLAMVDRIAPTQVTVLIQGESGTGKELIARRLHDMSDRKNNPYVTINCSALNENLLKSELFGHEKGAFTDAHALKIGLVETAHGGTLFLDEIGEMGKEIQAKLLRFLQEGEFYRVGGKKPLKVNVRIISATNKDLEQEVQKGHFREDLFYRLNTIILRVSPLRKRIEDIDQLVDHFLKLDFGGVKTKKITPEALSLLKQHDWPGNIRELQNSVERLKILSDGDEITENDIITHIKFSPKTKKELFDSHSLVALEELEKIHILKTLSYYQGNKSKTASTLGITIKTLYNKLSRYDNVIRH